MTRLNSVKPQTTSTPAVQIRKAQLDSSPTPTASSLRYVRFTSPTMLWGVAYGYAEVGREQRQGMFGFGATALVKAGDEIMVCRADGPALYFPIAGGAIACYEYAE